MSFWRSFGFHTVSAVENILERDSFTLEELMDEDELLQECKSQNQKLLDYLLQADTLAKLLFYLTTDPEPEAESKTRQKYPYLACEILCLEVWEICEAIYDNTNLLDQLWAFLDQPPPLSSKTASYVCRVAGVLLQRKIAESFQYLKSKDNVAEKFLQHIGNASVNELLLKVVQCDETAEGSGIVKWLTEQNLVDHLIEKLHPDQSSTVHENAAQALVDMISSPSLASSALVAEVEREDTFQKLFNFVLSGKSISSLSNGLTVIIDVVKREVTPVAGQPQPVEVIPVNPPGYVKVCLNNVKQLVSILNSPGEKKVLTSFGEIFPIGTHRLKIVEFYSALLGKQFAGVETQLFDLGVFDVVLDLFFTYFWNNFLHAVVTDMVWVVLDNPQSPNVVRLLSEFKLLDRICDASDGNAADVNRPKGCARGYMGFINRMSNRIVALQKTEPAVQQLCDAHDRWAEYVNVALKVQNDNDSMLLGGQKPVADESVQNSSGDEDGGMASMGNNELVNVFTQYLVKQGFTNDFPKDFLNDDDDEYDDEDEELEPGSRVLDKEFDEIQEPYTTEESDDEDEEDEVDGDEIISGADEDEDEGAGQGE